ncbi:MAG: hypothetical protein OEM99_10110 [Gammaproteobacteria bacterium]|nr:hypothetical protein [Gammaproteobacteria bacterium]
MTNVGFRSATSIFGALWILLLSLGLVPAAQATPDLQVAKLTATQVPVVRKDGSYDLAVKFVVSNSGSTAAENAKLAAFGMQRPSGPYRHLALRIPDQSDLQFGWTGPLAPRQVQNFTGTITLPSDFQGKHVEIYLEVDSTAGEEFAHGRVRELNESNNRSAKIIASVPAAVSSISALKEVGKVTVPTNVDPKDLQRKDSRIGPSGPISKPEKWTFNVTRLAVWRAAESNGDDPMLVPILFRARFGDPDSARTSFKGRPLKAGSGFRNGDIMTLGASYRLSRVRRIHNVEFENGAMPEIVGMIILAVEDNSTPDGRTMDMVSNAARLLREGLNKLIGGWDVLDASRVQATFAEIQERLQPSIGQAFGIALESGLDYDSMVGLQVVTFLTLDDRDPPSFFTGSAAGASAPLLKETTWSWNIRGSRPIIIAGDGHDWRVELKVYPESFYGRGDL